MPKQVKHGKPPKPRIQPFRKSTSWSFRGFEEVENRPRYGRFAIQATEEAWITNRAIEAIRRTLVQTMKRQGQVWIRIFPDHGITQRGADSRMGAGKGVINSWVAVVRPHRILFEMDGVDEQVARNACRKARVKLPCMARFLIKKDGPSLYQIGVRKGLVNPKRG